MWTAAEAVRVSVDRLGWRIWAAWACGRLPCRVWASQRVVSRALVSDCECLVIVWRVAAVDVLGVPACRDTSDLIRSELMAFKSILILIRSVRGLSVDGRRERSRDTLESKIVNNKKIKFIKLDTQFGN